MDDPRLGNLRDSVWAAFHNFSDEARKMRALVEKLPCPATPSDYEELLGQRLSETHAMENYLQLSNQLFVNLRVREKRLTEKPEFLSEATKKPKHGLIPSVPQ
jgi:hypothetical protein